MPIKVVSKEKSKSGRFDFKNFEIFTPESLIPTEQIKNTKAKRKTFFMQKASVVTAIEIKIFERVSSL